MGQKYRQIAQLYSYEVNVVIKRGTIQTALIYHPALLELLFRKTSY